MLFLTVYAVAGYRYVIAPHRPPGLVGFFLPPRKNMRACLLIDYQNIHLTGHDAFCPEGVPRHESLLLPGSYAQQIEDVRAAMAPSEVAQAHIDRIVVFRGMPSNRKQPESYSRSQAQFSQWSVDRRVEIAKRPLRYPPGWPDVPAQEKGIDVMLAVELIQVAMGGEFGVVIVATHDTDLEPAIETAEGLGSTVVETAGWQGRKLLRGGRGDRWHTFLNGAHFVRCRDRNPY